MFKKFLKSLIPPIFIYLFKRLSYQSDNSNVLFDGDDFLFKEILKDAVVYGEYGCGKSTKWVLNNTLSKVIAVDTSGEWVKNIQNDNKSNNSRLNIHHSNLGDVGSWGYPTTYIRQNFFTDYTDYLWNQIEKPNVVLIDGRFRVCCFLTSLKFAEEGTQILFDDYIIRAHYHFVEKYLSPIKECGRQCLFIVPPKNNINLKELDKDINSFRNVMA